jgi:GT2 family glycosyltransferase
MEHPFFSIIIPTYARPRQLAVCLQSLTRLDYPRDRFEVIVVDDGSEIPPEDVVAPFRSQIEVMLLTQANAGPAAARNTGAARAQGEFLAFTDDDCAPAPDWLQTLAARFAVTPDHLIGGRTLNALPANWYSTATQLLIAYLYAFYNADPHQARFFTSNNLALSAPHFHTLGGFDPTRMAGEDREFCDRWRHQGYRMVYAPEVLIYHAHAFNFRTFCQKHFLYGRGSFHFRQTRACRDQEPLRVEPLSFYLNLLRYPFSQEQGGAAWLLAALLVVSQVANGAGFLWERRNRTPEKPDLRPVREASGE